MNLFCKLLNNFQILAETFHQTEHSFKSKVLKIGYPIILLLTWYKRQVIVLNILYFEKSTIFRFYIALWNVIQLFWYLVQILSVFLRVIWWILQLVLCKKKYQISLKKTCYLWKAFIIYCLNYSNISPNIKLFIICLSNLGIHFTD